MIHPFALKTRILFLSLAMALVLVVPSFAQTDEETVAELGARLERVAGEAKTNRLIPGWCLVGAGAIGIGGSIYFASQPDYYQGAQEEFFTPMAIICGVPGTLAFGSGLLLVLIPTESENFLGEFTALPGDSAEEIAAKIERGEAMLETLALHGLQGRRAGAYVWFTLTTLELFAYIVFEMEHGRVMDELWGPGPAAPYRAAFLSAIVASCAAGALNLILKSRAELEWEAYQAWKQNPEGAASARLESPALRFTPTPLGFSLAVEF